MKNPKFSVIIPCHNRAEKLKRTLKSLDSQTFRDFEIILIDDASTDSTGVIMNNYKDFRYGVKVVSHHVRQERVACRNNGMKVSEGEWICWLDSDDEYMSNYLQILSDAIDTFPEYRIFNFGSIIHWHRTSEEFETKFGHPFQPAIIGNGHESFKSGHIGTGRFIFHRSLLEEIPEMIPTLRPYGDPGCFPELNRNPEYPMREDGQWVPFGNPWGEDYHWYWLITRNNISKPLNCYLYVEHRRP